MITARRTAADGNLQKLLDLREQAEYAIMAAMDYAKANLDSLGAKGYDIAGLNDTEKARIMYLTHHLGLGDAVHFIQNMNPQEDRFKKLPNGKKKLTQNGAKKLLIAQIGKDRAEDKYVKARDGSRVLGHRMWLDEFVNGAITPSKFTCAGDRLDTFKNQEISGKLELIVKDLKQ
jgi:hypothetical protein